MPNKFGVTRGPYSKCEWSLSRPGLAKGASTIEGDLSNKTSRPRLGHFATGLIMKFAPDRPYAEPEAAARKLIELANAVEAVRDMINHRTGIRHFGRSSHLPPVWAA
jgi:hypothetical protein